MSSTSRSAGGSGGVWIDGLILKSVFSTWPAAGVGAGLHKAACSASELSPTIACVSGLFSLPHALEAR